MKKISMLLVALFVFSVSASSFAGVQDTPKKEKVKTEKTVKKVKKSGCCAEKSDCSEKEKESKKEEAK